jgi:phosphoribosyl-AMP cyclohydrolase
MSELEEGRLLKLDFKKLRKVAASAPDVIPVTVQNAITNEVILLAYTNELAMKEALKKRKLILWSTSRNELWEKGKTSGETFELKEAFVNCEQNSLLYRVVPVRNGICHTKNKKGEPRNCFYRRIDFDSFELSNIDP